MLRKILRTAYTIWAISWFLLIMLLIFPFVIISTFFGKLRGGNMIYQLIYLWSDLWFFLAFLPKKESGQKPDPNKQYVFVANHVSNLDAAFLVKVIRQPIRPLGKIELIKVPVFGVIYKAVVVVVDRSDSKHRSQSVKQLRALISKGISILIFPEGTFNETGNPLKDCYDGAFRLAIETQTPIKPLIFPDTYARLQGDKTLTLNPGKCRAVWLEEFPVEGLDISHVPMLKQQVTAAMSTALRAHNASWIREEAQGDLPRYA